MVIWLLSECVFLDTLQNACLTRELICRQIQIFRKKYSLDLLFSFLFLLPIQRHHLCFIVHHLNFSFLYSSHLLYLAGMLMSFLSSRRLFTLRSPVHFHFHSQKVPSFNISFTFLLLEFLFNLTFLFTFQQVLGMPVKGKEMNTYSVHQLNWWNRVTP